MDIIINSIQVDTEIQTATIDVTVDLYRGERGLQGEQGEQGEQGLRGEQGEQGVQGVQGVKGDAGIGFKIAKTYLTVAALEADTTPTGILSGEFALITTVDPSDPDNGKLYIWNGSVYTYVTDMSVQGIQGERGEQGVQGIQGIQGVAGKSAYEAAIEGGYVGTESQFNTDLAKVSDYYTKGEINTLLTGKQDSINPTVDTTPQDTDEFISLRSGGWLKTTWSNIKNALSGIFGNLANANVWDLLQTFTSGIKTSTVRTITENNDLFASQDSTILWHTTKRFTPTGGSTIASSGTTVTLTGSTQFTSAMVGAKVSIGNEKRTITGYTSTSVVTVDRAFTQNYSGISDWGVYSKAKSYELDGASKFYGTDGTARFTIDKYGDISSSNGFSTGYFSLGNSMWAIPNNYVVAWSSTTSGNGTKDTGIRRKQAGRLQVYDGVTNTVNAEIEVSKCIETAIPEYADNEAALAAGLTAGMKYRTGDLLKIVH